MGYMPTLRGFVVGLALFVGVASVAGCFSQPWGADPPKTKIRDIATNLNHGVPIPGDPDFVGPVQPKTITERRAAADADFDKVVSQTTGTVLWALALITVGLVLFAAFSPGASWHGVITTGAAWVATLFLRHWLASWGVLLSNLSLIVVVVAIGYALIHNYRLRGKVERGEAKPSPTVFSLWTRIQALFSKPEVKP